MAASWTMMEPARVLHRVLSNDEQGFKLDDQKQSLKIGSEPSDGFTGFYDRNRGPVRRALVLAIGDVETANEAVDEALTRALANWPKIRTYDNPAGWVYRVGLNWARDGFRKRRYEVLAGTDPEVAGYELPAPDLDVIEAIGRLSIRLRSVVVARYYLDWSNAEVATALGIPEGTVKSRLSRALTRLEIELGEPT
jgi:RNA polymerase sigma-70 factor (ECF subfamily)